MNNHNKKMLLTICLFLNLLILSVSTVNAVHLTPVLNQQVKGSQGCSQPDKTISEIISKVNQTQLTTYIKKIQSFGPHPTGSNEINKLKTYLFNEFDSFQLDVTYHSWHEQEYAGENIIATLPGSISKNNLVIICAHYDTIAVSPGADDDGSGVSAILTMASILRNYSFNNTIQFILFSGEEQGCLGSNAYVKEVISQDLNVISVLALDKIGYAKTKEDGAIIRHHANPASSWMIDISENISKQFYKQIGLKILRLPFDASSDHRAFNDHNIAGSNLVEHTLNPYYHTSEDTLDKMNITYLQKVTKLATTIIATIAEGFSTLTSDDITISILGKNDNPYNARLSIIINNQQFPQQSALLSISIEMNHILQNKPVEIRKEYYSIPCVWNFNEKINETWFFHLGPQTYTKGFFALKVSIHGLYKDFPISKSMIRYGFIYPAYNLILFPF